MYERKIPVSQDCGPDLIREVYMVKGKFICFLHAEDFKHPVSYRDKFLRQPETGDMTIKRGNYKR